ncbi:MAG: transcription initiation protein [Sphingobacteriales bacterium]|nr:MAG: transcription initiation protein [Sphingobacteriales bacterium]
MEQYALIMRHEDGLKVASPEQIQVWMEQTMNWIGNIAAQNKFVSGTGLLFADAKIVKTQGNKPVVINGPFGDIKETIGGLIIVKADSFEEAVEFAKSSPVLQGEGNSVEVRRISSKDGVH